jgi:hypothetical protein
MSCDNNSFNYIQLAEKDKIISFVESQIEDKKQMLFEKQKLLKESVKENEYLEDVRLNYQKYYNFIIQEKRDQIKAIDLLTNYVKNIIIDENLTDADIENAKNDQAILTNELKSIQQKLDELVENCPDQEN